MKNSYPLFLSHLHIKSTHQVHRYLLCIGAADLARNKTVVNQA